MGRKRRVFTGKSKAKVAIEAVKGIKTLAELATEYLVYTNQISDWKKRLLLDRARAFFREQEWANQERGGTNGSTLRGDWQAEDRCEMPQKKL